VGNRSIDRLIYLYRVQEKMVSNGFVSHVEAESVHVQNFGGIIVAGNLDLELERISLCSLASVEGYPFHAESCSRHPLLIH